jgi:DNA polymerase-3 subunit epsilon
MLNIKESTMSMYGFLDVETTGTNQVRNGIIQIGGVLCRREGDTFAALEEFELNVAPYPTDLIEDEALAVSGITRDQILLFEPPDVVHKKLTDLFGKYCNKFDRKDKMVFVGYNASFDYGFLRRWFEKGGDKYFGSWFWHPPVDVMTLAMVQLAEVRQELADFKLGTVAARLHIPAEGAHTALADARTARAIFEKVALQL